MHRKYFSYIVIACCLFFIVQTSITQQSGFGLGIVIGEPTGISAKVWTSHETAVDVGVGWSIQRDHMNNIYYDQISRVHIHMDYLWHSFSAIHSSEQFPVYCGIGGRINSSARDDASFVARGVLGILWLPRKTPVDVFLELIPMLLLTPSSDVGLEAGIGIRYYF
ncbi:MAG: hypothetical protein WDA22_14360 [Bacteroidota bacterium]